MDRAVTVITGASGLLGSAICVDLARDHEVVAIDRRAPSEALRRAAPEVTWAVHDIASEGQVRETLSAAKARFGHLDYLVHFAAFYDFGNVWLPGYQATNVDGTANLIATASELGVRRAIFASSIAALEPPPPGAAVDHDTPASDIIPYAKSKRIGEDLFREAQDRLPGVVLRIGGAFTDWCEVPPLFSLIRLWGGPWPTARVIPGRGESAIPYIHRADLVSLVRTVLEKSDELGPYEVFLASQNGCVNHNQLFPVIRREAGKPAGSRPTHMPPMLAKVGLTVQCALGSLIGRMPYERPWMLDYVDRPLNVDTTKNQAVLGWDCLPERSIMARLPVIIANWRDHRKLWNERNVLRNEAQYSYCESETGESQ